MTQNEKPPLATFVLGGIWLILAAWFAVYCVFEKSKRTNDWAAQVIQSDISEAQDRLKLASANLFDLRHQQANGVAAATPEQLTAAKDEQERIEAEIRTLRRKLGRCETSLFPFSE